MSSIADVYRKEKGNLIVLSGPSGVGKGTICKELLRYYSDIVYSISATTRKARLGEVHGKDYFFYSKDEFLKMVEEDAFLEWAKVYDNYYGTPKLFVEEITSRGKDCILEIDVQGALQVKERKPEGVFIFIVPPSKEELIRRITCRGTENEKEVAKRMEKVDDEIALLPQYDYMVENDNLQKAVELIRCIILAERTRIHNHKK
ncbi:MAG: guanylate kinase [Firmicutes bacterium HGW-Firmicutes-12]|jgi:guanylate kinase|nr:MAG: guanylate kinase [Firmicutes bacterium HGW-Firmicutes-12]